MRFQPNRLSTRSSCCHVFAATSLINPNINTTPWLYLWQAPREIESLVMGKKFVWYILAQQGSEPSEDAAENVTLDDDDTIAISNLKQEVLKQNSRKLSGFDVSDLEVFECGKTENRCKPPRTKLNTCISGSDVQPFWIFYTGTAAEPPCF